MKTVLAGLATTLALIAFPAWADKNCKCRCDGNIVAEITCPDKKQCKCDCREKTASCVDPKVSQEKSLLEKIAKK